MSSLTLVENIVTICLFIYLGKILWPLYTPLYMNSSHICAAPPSIPLHEPEYEIQRLADGIFITQRQREIEG